MKPTVGRIVHYYPDATSITLDRWGEGPYAAVVTAVHQDDSMVVSLAVFARPGDDVFGVALSDIPFGREGTRRWCWPPREGATT